MRLRLEMIGKPVEKNIYLGLREMDMKYAWGSLDSAVEGTAQLFRPIQGWDREEV